MTNKLKQEPQLNKHDVTGSVYKILNLYACLGGNRYKWDEVAKEKGIEIEVTAIEYDEELARMYKERFPNDKVIVTDAHQYLLENFKNFDFIWSSPPCPSHSRIRFGQANSERENYNPVFPDMKLYEEIIFLDNYFRGKYVVENVIPFYEPLIPAKKRGRHLYWTNFNLPTSLNERPQPKGFIESGDTDSICQFIHQSQTVRETFDKKQISQIDQKNGNKTIVRTSTTPAVVTGIE